MSFQPTPGRWASVGIFPREESGVRIWRIVYGTVYGYSMVTLCALQQTKIAMENGPSEDVISYWTWGSSVAMLVYWSVFICPNLFSYIVSHFDFKCFITSGSENRNRRPGGLPTCSFTSTTMTSTITTSSTQTISTTTTVSQLHCSFSTMFFSTQHGLCWSWPRHSWESFGFLGFFCFPRVFFGFWQS